MHANHHSRPYGVGLAYRYVVHGGLLEHQDEIDLLEISTEDYIIRQRRVEYDPDERLLHQALALFPCVAHGLSLSIGSVEPLDRAYLMGTRRFLAENQLTVFSEHLAFHRFAGCDLTMFLEMPFDELAVEWIERNYRIVRSYLGRPFALENVTYPFPVANAEMSEPEFWTRVSEETDCSFLLDVTNLYNNACNHGYDAYAFLDSYPLERVTQLHLAGGRLVDGIWEDSHSRPVMEPVWELYEEVLRRTEAEIVILERDSRFEPFSALMKDVRKARELFYQHRPAQAQEKSPHILIEPKMEGALDAGSKESQFVDLREFQRSVMARITDPNYRRAYYDKPSEKLAELRISPAWKERVRRCDRAAMAKLESTWDGLSQIYREEAEEFEQQEWAAWADKLRDDGGLD